jgi:thiol:disulfide interchange protein
MQPKDSSKGIRFEHGLSWAQVKEKAKAENKYIFMDCYATWCGPCKAMDKNV